MRWLALLLLIGCGDNFEGITLEQRQAEETHARCEQLTRCGLFGDEATCVAFIRPKDERALFAAVANGTVLYRPTSENACLRELANVSCDRTARDARLPPLSCEGAFVGTRAAGASCAFDEQCSTGRCSLEPCEDTMCCAGTCKRPRGAAGGSCQRHDDCIDGLYCAIDQTCTRLGAANASCTSDVGCDIGLACVSGICRGLPRMGEACPYGRCADIGARCASSICVPVGLPGVSCVDDSECSQYGRCDSGRCIDIPGLGMPCDGRCAGVAFCMNGVCAMPLENGEPCGAFNQCASQLCAEGPIFDVCAERPVCY
jgi:hypothetical protein